MPNSHLPRCGFTWVDHCESPSRAQDILISRSGLSGRRDFLRSTNDEEVHILHGPPTEEEEARLAEKERVRTEQAAEAAYRKDQLELTKSSIRLLTVASAGLWLVPAENRVPAANRGGRA